MPDHMRIPVTRDPVSTTLLRAGEAMRTTGRRHSETGGRAHSVSNMMLSNILAAGANGLAMRLLIVPLAIFPDKVSSTLLTSNVCYGLH